MRFTPWYAATLILAAGATAVGPVPSRAGEPEVVWYERPACPGDSVGGTADRASDTGGDPASGVVARARRVLPRQHGHRATTVREATGLTVQFRDRAVTVVAEVRFVRGRDGTYFVDGLTECM